MSIGHSGLPRGEVPAAFDHGAAAYDRLVGANPGYHQHLRISARRMRIPEHGRGLRLLDAGCGTGASTAALPQLPTPRSSPSTPPRACSTKPRISHGPCR